MAQELLLPHSIREGTIVPHYLTERDHVWLRLLVEEFDRFVGRPRHELEARLKEELPCASPPRKRRLAEHVLSGIFEARQRSAVAPPAARSAVFRRAALGGAREGTLAAVAEEFSVDGGELLDALFADLPGERRVTAPVTAPSPAEIALRANLLLAQGLLRHSTRVELEVQGNARLLIRQAKLRGLICTVVARGEAGATLDISGPLTVLRRTLLYGRALAELVPLLQWCERFRLRAECAVGERRAHAILASGDPIFPAAEPRRYDSRLEERFAREFRRAAPGWDAIREPEPIEAGGTLIFPDFALVERGGLRRRWLLEIVGFWTADYVREKLARLRAAGRRDLVLCLDGERCCGEEDLPVGTPVVRFRRRIEPADVLRAIEEADRGGARKSRPPCGAAGDEAVAPGPPPGMLSA